MSLADFRTLIADIPHTDDPALVRRKSRDMTVGFSPILREQARDRTAELVVSPRNRDEVIRIAAAAARHRVAVLPRGLGTCNWGQGIPLAGGIILEMTGLDRVVRNEGDTIRVEPGMVIEAVDAAARARGRELRMFPSSKRISTIGGFVGGGHVGIGSVAWGILHDRGNLTALQAISLEETPRIVELRGSEVNLMHHTYGTTGIVTEIELPLAHAQAWREAVVDFDDFMDAARFGHAMASADGLLVKMVAVNAWPYPSYFTPLARFIRDGRHTVHVIVAEPSAVFFEELAAEHNGTIVYQGPEGMGDFGRPLYEFSFGHARFHANKVNPKLLTNIGIFPHNDILGAVGRVYARFRDLGPLRLDFKRMDGQLTCQGAPLFEYQGPEHMARFIEELQSEGVQSANTHTMHVKENGMKPITARERAFRAAMDPHGLCNPGKFEASDVETADIGASLPTTGWHQPALAS